MPHRICFSLILLSFFVTSATAQQVFINEFMSSNSFTIADENDDFEYWIEIYNQGTASVSLAGYGLSDDLTEPFRWVFPGVSI